MVMIIYAKLPKASHIQRFCNFSKNYQYPIQVSTSLNRIHIKLVFLEVCTYMQVEKQCKVQIIKTSKSISQKSIQGGST